MQQFLLRSRRGARAAVDGETALVEPHLGAIAEADEGIAREALAALDALQQEARLERLELEIRRHRRVQVGSNVEWRFQAAAPRQRPRCARSGREAIKKPISGFALGDGFFGFVDYVTCVFRGGPLLYGRRHHHWPEYYTHLRHGGEYYRRSPDESNSHNFMTSAVAEPLCHRRSTECLPDPPYDGRRHCHRRETYEDCTLPFPQLCCSPPAPRAPTTCPSCASAWKRRNRRSACSSASWSCRTKPRRPRCRPRRSCAPRRSRASASSPPMRPTSCACAACCISTAATFTDDVTPETADTWILRRVRPILEGTLNGIYDFRFTPDFARRPHGHSGRLHRGAVQAVGSGDRRQVQGARSASSACNRRPTCASSSARFRPASCRTAISA